MRVLLLGGTTEARELAHQLIAAGHDVTSSLAGRVSAPRLPDCTVRIGGFGGADGLASYLATERIDQVVDATHPFAAQITRHAVQACERAGVPIVRLSRPSWDNRDGAASWTWVADHTEAAATVRPDARVLLTVGRLELAHYASLPNQTVIARVADLADLRVPEHWEVIESRGPFSLTHERELLASHRITTLVSKDAGGDATSAKLDAARERGVQIVMIARPALPAGLIQVSTPEELVRRLA